MVRYFTTARIKRRCAGLGRWGSPVTLARISIRRTLLGTGMKAARFNGLRKPRRSSAVYRAASPGARRQRRPSRHRWIFSAQNRLDIVSDIIAQIKGAGLVAGVAGHNPRVHVWADEHLELDFHMCSYYNPTRRDENAAHVQGSVEVFAEADREAMVDVIRQLRRPAIHYKIFAAGRHNPRDAFAFVARHLRPQDAVCIGVFPKYEPDMLAEDVRLFHSATDRS